MIYTTTANEVNLSHFSNFSQLYLVFSSVSVGVFVREKKDWLHQGCLWWKSQSVDTDNTLTKTALHFHPHGKSPREKQQNQLYLEINNCQILGEGCISVQE